MTALDLHWNLLMDALRHARLMADRLQDAHDGSEPALLFSAVEIEIVSMITNSPALKALNSYRLRNRI